MIFHNFRAAINAAHKELVQSGIEIHTDTWQGQKIDEKFTMLEILNLDLTVMNVPEDIWELIKQIQPDLPWADDHFLERVSRHPLNPGDAYRNWKFFKNTGHDEKFRSEGGKFSHTYMERFWPKKATLETLIPAGYPGIDYNRKGIRYDYGDLDDVVNLLLDDNKTRQAYLPVWFPEDTGAIQKQRVPCTLGYLFFMRNNMLHINYYIRACDAFKHFRNDIYLTTRLLLWVLEELRTRQSHESKLNWHKVKPGIFTMHIANFHVFKTELNLIK